MATYTMELYKAIESSPDGDIGLNSYPIWDEEYRESLNTKIIDHYHNQEIGSETVDMFRFAMRRRMAEVMPYYNDLYATIRSDFDPLSTIDIRTISTGTNVTEAEGSGESTTSGGSTGKSRAINSQFPQNQLAGRGDYATSGADTNSESTNEGTGTENSNTRSQDQSDSETHVTGYQGIPGELIQRYRDSLLNIDLMIISELTDLFMGVWGNSDSYTPYPFTPLY